MIVLEVFDTLLKSWEIDGWKWLKLLWRVGVVQSESKVRLNLEAFLAEIFKMTWGE